MEHRRKKVVLSVLVCVLFLGSCGDRVPKQEAAASGKDSAESVEALELRFPETYEETTDDTLSFQARIIPPVNISAENNEIHVSYKNVDFEEALKELFTDVGEIKRNEMILQPENSLYQEAYGEQDEVMASSIGMFRMEKTQWNKVRNTIELSQKDLAYNVEEYTSPQKFTFGTAEQKWEELQKVLSKLGMETELKPTFLYMDFVTMEKEAEKNKELEEFEEERDWDWSEDDNGYYISAVQCVDGNPVYANTYYGNGLEGGLDTANVFAYIDRSGIQMLELARVIGTVEETDRNWKPLPFEDIVDAVKKRFDLVITGDKAEVKEFRFSYMTEAVNDEVYRLLPVWFCNYEQTGRDGTATMRQMIIHAETGEEVIYELY